MSRYFAHLKIGDEFLLDHEGNEVDLTTSPQELAATCAHEFLEQLPWVDWGQSAVVLTDELGDHVATVTFAQAVSDGWWAN
jgi:hypothetical protein